MKVNEPKLELRLSTICRCTMCITPDVNANPSGGDCGQLAIEVGHVPPVVERHTSDYKEPKRQMCITFQSELAEAVEVDWQRMPSARQTPPTGDKGH